MIRVLFVSVFLYVASVVCSLADVDAKLRVDDPDAFIYALIRAENPWLDKNRVGDKSLYHKAFGLLQVRKPYIDDVNRIVGKSAMRKMWGKDKLTTVDMKDKTRAIWATKIYLVYYGKQYESRTGKKVSPQVYARIHNGGPSGWKKWVTYAYWHKVKSRMVDNYVVMTGDADTVNPRLIEG